MKIAVYSAREDEKPFFAEYKENNSDIEYVMVNADPTMESAHFAEGCECVNIVQKTVINAQLLDEYKRLGVKFVASRTVGFEHVDCVHAKEIGIGVTNISYTPKSVAEYAVMMMLASLRNMKTIMIRSLGQDYSLSNVIGRLISDCTVGIVGTGQIGSAVCQILTGFGCKIYAYDLFEREELKGVVTYLPFEEMLEKCDIISIHAPSTAENYHLFNEKTIAKMKDGSVLINTARGELVDSNALIEALENEHLGGCALDVIEGDRLIYYRDKKSQQLCHREMAILQSMPNAIVAPHMAFYSEHAVRDMVVNSLDKCVEYVKNN